MGTKALKSAGASFIATMVLSGTGIAIADDKDVSLTAEAASIVATDVRNNDDTSNSGEVVASGLEATENPQTADETETDQPLVVVHNECSRFESGDGFLVQRCVGVDVAKSSVSAPEGQMKAAIEQSVVATAPAQSQRASVASTAGIQPFSPLVTSDVAVESVDATARSTEIEKPTLPITGAGTTAVVKDGNKGVTAGKHGADSSTLIFDNPFIAASARATIFAMVACAVFALVGASSFVSVRRMVH